MLLKIWRKQIKICQNNFFRWKCVNNFDKTTSKTTCNHSLFNQFLFNVSSKTIFTDKLAVQKETYNAICADMDTTFAEMAGF